MTTTRALTFFATSLLALSAMQGCAVEATEETGESEDDLSAMKYYDCRAYGDDASMKRVELGIGATKIAVTDLSQDAVVPDTGTYDSSYRPTSSTYQGSARYVGFRKIQDEIHQNADFILSKELKAKGANGKLWLRTQDGEGGGTQTFSCSAKAKRLTVNTNQMGRIACELQPGIAIAGGPPPGSTGLYDLFLFQHDTETSKITFTYLDHFGVRATERKESISTSDSFSRTTKRLTGKWGKNTLDVTYRGGITYEGTFKYEDGQKTKVKCNDLAMLDAPR